MRIKKKEDADKKKVAPYSKRVVMSCILKINRHADDNICIITHSERSGSFTGEVCGANMHEVGNELVKSVGYKEKCAEELISGLVSGADIADICHRNASETHHSLRRACRKSGWQEYDG